MAEYTIHFTTTVSSSVTVEAADEEEAIEKAYEGLPGSMCAQCSGWGQPWNRDESGEWEVSEVEGPESES